MISIRYTLVFFLILLPLSAAEAATLYVSPDRGTYSIGDTFEVNVIADSAGELINAAEAELNFDAEVLRVEEIRTDGSILSQWPTLPTYSNEEGIIQFAGWTKESFNGPNGLLITIVFKALRNNVSNAHLAAGAILAADGQGSNIITTMRSGVYRVEPQEIIAEEPPPNLSGDVHANELPQVPTLEYEKDLSVGEQIIVRGETMPGARVLVWLKKGGEEETRTDVMSADDGSYAATVGDRAEAGVYRIWVQAETEEGERSPTSPRGTINVRPSGLAAVAFSGTELVSALLPLIALLIVGGLGIGYLFHRHAVEKMKHARVESEGGTRG